MPALAGDDDSGRRRLRRPRERSSRDRSKKLSCHEEWQPQWRASRPEPEPDDVEGAATEKPARKRRERKPTLAGVAKQVSRAGIEVARYEVKPDGTVVVVTGKTDTEQTNDLDNWIAKHADTGQRH